MPNPIPHKLIVVPGNPAEDAIKGVNLLEKTLADSAKGIEKSAQAIKESLKNVNVTTKQGQEATRKAATETKKLTEKQKFLSQQSKTLAKTKEQLYRANGAMNKGIIKQRVELQKTNQEIKRNALVSRSQKGSYDQLTATLNKNIAKWKAMTTAERTATKHGKALTATIQRQDAQLKKLDKQIGRSQRNVGNYGSAFTSLGAAMGVTLGAAGIFMVLKNAIGVIAGFEKEMAKVKAISGATASEFAQLEQQAKDLGATTLFTAKQVATLEVAYSKLGFTTKEILNATAATLDLAVATDSDLSSAAEVAGSTLRGFGLDAIEMTRVVDVMAKGFTTSALDIENFRESMKLVAPIAKAAGIDIEITTNLLGKLADAGLKGSIGATGLKNVLLELSNINSKLGKHLGFAVKNADDLQRALNILASESLTLAEAQQLIDKRGQAALLTLANNKDIADLLTDSYEGVTGSARDMAEVMEGTLSASVTLLGSAWDGFILSLSGSKGAMKTTIDTITTFISGLTLAIKYGTTDIEKAYNLEHAAFIKNEEEKTIKLGEKIALQKELNKIRFDLTKQEYMSEIALQRMALDSALKTDKHMSDSMKIRINARIELLDETIVKINEELKAEQDSNDKKSKLLKEFNEKNRETQSKYDDQALKDQQEFEQLLQDDHEKTLKEDEKASEDTNKKKLKSTKEFLDAEAKMKADARNEEQKALDREFEELQQWHNEMRALMDMNFQTLTNGYAQSITGFAMAVNDIAQLLEQETVNMADVITAALLGIRAIGEGIFNQRANEISEEMRLNEEQKAYELSLVEGNAEAEIKINKKFAEKEKKLKEERDKNNRNAAIFQAIINTAIGVTQALAQGGILGIILGALVAAAGAVEIASIATTPLPKYEKGGHGKLDGKRHSDGGVKINGVGEAEKDEYFGVINRDKTNKYSEDLPSIFDSLNNGNFEHIWQRTSDSINVSVRDKYGKRMYEQMKQRETQDGNVRIIRNGNRTLKLR